MAPVASRSSEPGSGTNVSTSFVNEAVRRWARGPLMLIFEGATSVTMPPPLGVRSKLPIATTDGRATPLVVSPENTSVPGVQAKKLTVLGVHGAPIVRRSIGTYPT